MIENEDGDDDSESTPPEHPSLITTLGSWDDVLKDLDDFLKQPGSSGSGTSMTPTTTSASTTTSTSGSTSTTSTTSTPSTTSTTSTSTAPGTTPSSSGKPASGWQAAKPRGGAQAPLSGVGSGGQSALPQAPGPSGEDHLRTVSNDAMSRAFQSFDDLFGAHAKKLAAQDGYRKTRQKFMEQALASKKALTPEAAEELVAKFWVEVLWHCAAPLFEPTPGRRDAIRNQLAALLLRTLRAVKLSGLKVSDCAPIIAFVNWNRDCLIAQGETDAFDVHLHSVVRAEIAAALQDYGQSAQKQQTLFREGRTAQLAFASTAAFYPFLSHLMQKFENLKLEKDSREQALASTDQARLKAWVQALPSYLKLVDKHGLAGLMEVMAQEVRKALPDGSADAGVLAKNRKYLLLRCVQAAFIRGSVALGLQGSPLVQPRNHALGRLFCSSMVTTIFNAAALIAADEDPASTLRKKFELEPFDDAMACARAAAEAMAVMLGQLADAALDAAKAHPT